MTGGVRRRIPEALKRRLRVPMIAVTARRVAARPRGAVPSTRWLRVLNLAWGNQGFSADPELLQVLAEEVGPIDGPVLECGSGVSTLLMGLLLRDRAIDVHALEHHPEWARRVRGEVRRRGLERVHVHHAPLKAYDGFEWYDREGIDLPTDFQLVLCDGPPGSTPGGRYGVLPVLGDHLADGCRIIVDDTERDGEQEVLRRWARLRPLEVSQHTRAGGSKGFAIVTLADRNP